MTAELTGWRDARSGVTTLRAPGATASLELTPALEAVLLTRMNPFLRGIAPEVRQGERVRLTYKPEGMALPCRRFSLRVEPLRTALEAGSELRQLLSQLQLAPPARRLEVRTSALRLDVEDDGPTELRRMDVVVVSSTAAESRCRTSSSAAGGGGGGDDSSSSSSIQGGAQRRLLQLAFWGSVDDVSDRIDMRVGLPACTLALAGLTDVPWPGYVLPVEVSGTPERPQVHAKEALLRVAQLTLRQRLRQHPRQQAPQPAAAAAPAAGDGDVKVGSGGAAALLGRLFGAAVEVARGSAASTAALREIEQQLLRDQEAVPPPPEPLPWAEAAADNDAAAGGGRPGRRGDL